MPVLKSGEKGSRSKVYISLGSNLGDKEKNLKDAIEFMKCLSYTDVISVSPFYLTEPQGVKEQPYFLNGVVKLETMLKPDELLDKLKRIEETMGRKKTRRWGPRIIDLDIVFYDDIVLEDEKLVIPHPQLRNRWFVLKPLNDIEPDFKHPVIGKTVNQLLEEINGKV
jgi:dihydroneopterin aldolase/2-amino-4-hydroxy-6-hydroxymethyldihydropteridine diphosphokinase